MTTLEEQYRQYESEDGGWIRLHSYVQQKAKTHDTSAGSSPENLSYNRYHNMIAYDQTRVKLNRINGFDYINANYVTVSKALRRYILTQGPLPKTISHFWAMIWEQKSSVIVMLNRVYESEAIAKCEAYWPREEGSTDSHEDVDLSVTHEGMVSKKHFTIRTLILTDLKSKQTRKIKQYNYTSWPDHGSPDSPTSVLRLLTDIRKSGGFDRMDEPPVVHCSAGVGRSGTLILIDSILSMIENQRSSDDIDIVQTLLEMRDCRTTLVQTPDQLKFAFMTILYGKTILQRANLLQPHLTSTAPPNRPQSRTTDKTSPKRKGRKGKKKVSTAATKEADNIFHHQLLIEALDQVDSDTADCIFYDTIKPMPSVKKPRSDLTRDDIVDRGPSSAPILFSLSSGTSLAPESSLWKRRELNKKLAEKTAEIKRKMQESELRHSRFIFMKKWSTYGAIVTLVISSAFYIYQRYVSH